MHKTYKVSNSHSSSKVNVLVFSGSGVSPSCLLHLKNVLQSLLSSRYDVLSISADSLIKDPWTVNCALLAFPGGRDRGYLSSLGVFGCKRIADWVRNEGGRYLGLCAGAYFASDRIEFESGRDGFEIIEDRPLKFYSGICKGTAFPGFIYGSEEGARDAMISLESDVWRRVWQSTPPKLSVYYNGGGYFEDTLQNPAQATIIARYAELQDEPAAGVLCQVGESGKAILWGVHPEHPSVSASTSDIASLGSGAADARNALLKATLLLLDLDVPQNAQIIVVPTPLLLTSQEPAQTQRLAGDILLNFPDSDAGTYVDFHSSFRFHPQTQLARNFSSSRNIEHKEIDLIVCSDSYPLASTTPIFNLESFFSLLANARKHLNLPFNAGFGSTVLYGEVVTSTQTILDKNPRFLAALPQGFVFVGSHQIAGRGRGTNNWLSPPGCLQFSLVLRVPKFLGSKLVFVQYLFGLSVVEAVRGIDGYQDLELRLKWPNDLYAHLGEKGGLQKIGGILVNSTFAGGDFTVIIGCGINTTNSTPTTSLLDLIRSHAAKDGYPLPVITQEQLLALILPRFESMWAHFQAQGNFESFADLYTKRWLHSGAIVSVQETGQRVRIVGLAPDNGYLRTQALEKTSNSPILSYLDLQPDGNSFDMMQGLLKVKI